MVEALRSGLAGQIGIGTEPLHAPGTKVVPTDFIEYTTEAIVRDSVEVAVQGMAGTLFPRVGRRRRVFRGATGPMTVPLLTKGLARMLRHAFGGYAFSWPGGTPAEGELTLNSAPSDGDTVTIGSHTYTFKTSLTSPSAANEVLIGADEKLSAANLAAAINRGLNAAGQGPGEVYGSATPRNADVDAIDNGDGTITVVDRQARGAAVNSGGDDEIGLTETLTDSDSGWDNATLTGGVNGTDAARKHTFTIDPGKLRELAATLQNVRPASESSRKTWNYYGAKIISWELAHAGDGALMFTPTWHARFEDRTMPAAVPSYPSGATFFSFTQATVEIDDVEESVQGFSLSAALALATDRFRMGTSAPRNQVINDRPSITGNIEHEFENMDLYEAFMDQVTAKLEYIATGDQIPLSASNYSVHLTLPAVLYDGSTPTVGGPGLVQQPIPFTVMEDGLNPPITLEIVTDEGYVGDESAPPS